LRDGVITGYYKTYYDNGQLDTISTMEDGTKHGRFRSYDRDGNLLVEGGFVDGKRHVPNTGYYPDGSIRHRFTYKEGQKTGANFEYYPDGTVKVKEQVALNGQDRTIEEFNEKGARMAEKKFRNAVPNGTWTFYFEDGKTPRIKETYSNGKLTGERYEYFPGGTISKIAMYKFGLLA